ncbi:MAG: outer membrane protein assembly factor BamD, partial [candidate division WOR-3 bacterium]|nr:outer membrane protein assembly factor BamD [candidate division WOR-3 bacterium]
YPMVITFKQIVKYFSQLLLSLMFILVIFLNCGNRQTIVVTNSPEQAFNIAMDFFQTKKYNKAIEQFRNIVFSYPGTSYAVDAQFYLADAYFQKKDYYAAITEFEFFINSFTGSQYQEEAIYKLALCYFNIAPSVIKDQNMLLKSLDLLAELQERFPETKYQTEILRLRQKIYDRWAEKSFRIGELYYKGEEYTAARVYFDYVQNEFPNTKWANFSRLYIGQIYERTDSIDQAINIYQVLLNDSTDLNVQKIAQQRLSNLEKKNK